MSVVSAAGSGSCPELRSVLVAQEKAGVIVAKIVEFYVPSTFRKSGKWIPTEQRGKVIEFVAETKKSA